MGGTYSSWTWMLLLLVLDEMVLLWRAMPSLPSSPPLELSEAEEECSEKVSRSLIMFVFDCVQPIMTHAPVLSSMYMCIYIRMGEGQHLISKNYQIRPFFINCYDRLLFVGACWLPTNWLDTELQLVVMFRILLRLEEKNGLVDVVSLVERENEDIWRWEGTYFNYTNTRS